MLSRSKIFKRPASSNPKLPSIQSDPGPAETSEKNEADQVTVIPIQTPPEKWQDNKTWPPPLNLSPKKTRRKSVAIDARDVSVGPTERGCIEKEVADSWQRSNVDCTKATAFEKEAKDNAGPMGSRSAKSRFANEEASPDLKDDINRLKKDKRIMSSLLKQCQRELTKNESAVKELSRENEHLKKEMLALKALLVEEKEKQNTESKSVAVCTFSENNSKEGEEAHEVEGYDKFEPSEIEKDKKIVLLQQDIKTLKDCLNNVYRKISFVDHPEESIASSDGSGCLLLTENENFESHIEKLNNCVEHIIKAYNELSVKSNGRKKVASAESEGKEMDDSCKNFEVGMKSWAQEEICEKSGADKGEKEKAFSESLDEERSRKEMETKMSESTCYSGSEKLLKEGQSKQQITRSFSENGRPLTQVEIKHFLRSGKSVERAKTSKTENLSGTVEYSKELEDKYDLNQVKLVNKIKGLQAENKKLEDLLMACHKAQIELKSDVQMWKEKCKTLQEENNEFQSQIQKMKNELENFQLSIMETVRLALDIEFPEMKVPTDVLTAAIVEIAKECHALRALLEKMESSEKEQQKFLNHFSQCILEAENKLQQEGRSVVSLQDAIQKLEVISLPKETDLDKTVTKIYSNSLEWENNIINKLKLIGIPIDDPTTDICFALDKYAMEYETTKGLPQANSLTKEAMKCDFGTQVEGFYNETAVADAQMLQNSFQQKEALNDSGFVCSMQPTNVLGKSVEPDAASKENKGNCQPHGKKGSDVSVALLDDLIENSSQLSTKVVDNRSGASITSSKISATANESEESNIEKSKDDVELLKQIKEFHEAVIDQGQVLSAKDEKISSDLKLEIQPKLFGQEDGATEIQETVIVKKDSKQEEAVPYDRDYSSGEVQKCDIGTQVEESELIYIVQPSDRHEIGVQTTFFPPEIIEDPERLHDLEMTVEEMRDVEKHHMHVACDLAEKLNQVAQSEAKLKIMVEALQEDKERAVDAVKEEWLEIEKQYRDEITSWQLNASKQGEVLRQLQIHFEQAQYMIYEKEVEIAELQRTVAVLQEKLQYDRTMKRYLAPSERNVGSETDFGSNKKYEMGPEEVLQNQIKQLNEQLAATKLCLRTARAETTKCLQKEMQYYNDIVQKKEQHIKRLQTELSRQRAEIEAKEAIILRQRREIRQSNVRWHKCQKDNWAKDDLILKLKQQLECNIPQTEQEKLSTIGTRCLEEQHHQILEEYKTRIKELENIFSTPMGNGTNTDHHIHNSAKWRSSNNNNSSRLEVIEEQQQFNELFLYDIIKKCEETYLNLVNTLAHALGITELEGAASLVIVPHMEWSTVINERRKDQKRFLNAIEILKTLTQNEYADQEERLRKTELKLQSATEQITRLQENNRSKLHELKQAEKILRITRRSLERERTINASIKQNRKKLEQLTSRIIAQKEDNMLKVEEDIKKNRKEIMKTEKKLEDIELKLAADQKIDN